MGKQSEQWLRSKEAMKLIRATSCELAHLRQDGKIQFKKEGNAFLYSGVDLEAVAAGRARAAKRKV